MTWKELIEKQSQEVKAFNDDKMKQYVEMVKTPQIDQKQIDAFNIQWKQERVALFKAHEAEAKKFLNVQEYEEGRLSYFKQMAKDYPDNPYWAEAVQRMQTQQKIAAIFNKGQEKDQGIDR